MSRNDVGVDWNVINCPVVGDYVTSRAQKSLGDTYFFDACELSGDVDSHEFKLHYNEV
jgi:hypothetical protein